MAAIAFDFMDIKVCNRFVTRTFDYSVKFTPEQILEINLLVDQSIFEKAETSESAFSKKELEEIYMLVSGAVFQKLSKIIFAGDERADGSIDEVQRSHRHNGKVLVHRI